MSRYASYPEAKEMPLYWSGNIPGLDDGTHDPLQTNSLLRTCMIFQEGPEILSLSTVQLNAHISFFRPQSCNLRMST